MADADLFRDCRTALGLSAARMAAILGIADGRTSATEKRAARSPARYG
jgi:hypothetical protein